ncbi:PREDICTED: phosphatidylinositol-binding clathrin assembly protein-like isoform X2 [Chinchilla lanigera]|uniref:phosphatidylinositol-binding clathrin assembly protein-like isoform X2 n=1 Tax=Chinchilla lanigera TaxID=34839 RepID=UPI000698A7ED|nr:PREDICTED: phosphatidylinositol-binding clathrin assembly protein-like isoform X2 [Chinchilla lanigera]
MGSSASKAALRATTNEPTEPEAKHLADLTQYINETNMSVEHLASVLSEKTGSSSWVVVFKALVTTHHLMVHGDERFIQHLASRNSLFTLHNFLDDSVIEGYSMSTFIRRYSRYLNEKSLAYRFIASDITKTKRGTNGVMRTMNTKELLNTLPVIQTQFDALLNFNANPDELTNGIIHAAFLLLFKDSLRLFAAYNEGILNLLDKYFNMRRSQCKESLDIYIKFLGRTTKLTQFLKVAEAPHSLIEALKQHLIYLEKKNDCLPPYRLQREFIPSIPVSPVVKASASQALSTVFPSEAHRSVRDRQQGGVITANSIDGTLASLVQNLNFGEHVLNKKDMKWCQASEMEISTGMNWQLNTYICTSTIWNSISGRKVIPTSMGSPSLMASQSTIYTHQHLKTSKLSMQSPGREMQPMQKYQSKRFRFRGK